MSELRMAVLSSGMWRLNDVISSAAQCEVVRLRRGISVSSLNSIAGWGEKETSVSAKETAKRLALPYVAIEDGWLRSISPGPTEKPRSLVIDRTGIYYNAEAPSDLETYIAESAQNNDQARLSRAESGIELLRTTKISKYNSGPRLGAAELGLNPRSRRRVLVVDQTIGDASVNLGMASEGSFRSMLAAAEAENEGAEIVVKLHPEVVSGRKRGYLESVDRERFTVIGVAVNPWDLIEAVDRVYVVTSQLGFEALMGGRPVTCFGAPFYAGWGLTDDRVEISRRVAKPTLEQLFAAAYFDYAVYVDTATGSRVTFEDTVKSLLVDREARKATPERRYNLHSIVAAWSAPSWTMMPIL